jgi:hypothetical protein
MMLRIVKWSNVRAQAGRAESVRLPTETESRPCLEHVCSARDASRILSILVPLTDGEVAVRARDTQRKTDGCNGDSRAQSILPKNTESDTGEQSCYRKPIAPSSPLCEH